MAYIGASQDGLRYCKCHGKSVVKIKCSSIKYKTVFEGHSSCKFLTLQEGKIMLKQNNKYTQIISQIDLSNVSGGYFVACTNKGILINRIEFDRNLWASLSQNLEIVFKSYVIQRLPGTNNWVLWIFSTSLVWGKWNQWKSTPVTNYCE